MAAAIVIDDETGEFSRENELLKGFKVITEGKPLKLGYKSAVKIIEQNLLLPNVDKSIMDILVELLPFYIQSWPGWNRSKDYLAGKMTYENWYQRFTQYLLYKLNTIIKNETKYLKTSAPHSVKECKDAEVQTQVLSNKELKEAAQFSLTLAGTPSVVSNLVFLASDDNIVVKQHNDKEWQALQLHEFLNWPDLGIELRLPEISVSRYNKHECYRYITMAGDLTINPEYEYVDSITATSEDHEAFTHNFIYSYVRDLTTSLRKTDDNRIERVKQISTILNQFLNDVSAVDLHGKTVATNTTVSFNIGKSKYLRNKKILGNGDKTVNFYEIIIPRVQFTLNHFLGEQDETSIVFSFKSLNLLQKSSNDDINQIIDNACITYKCLFCSVSFDGTDSMEKAMEHFEFMHKNEQSLLCFKCRKSYEVKDLSANRWLHVCESTT